MEILLNALMAFTGTLVGFFFGSRKNNAETDRIVIENVKEILGVYSTTINDLKMEIKELKEKIDKYEQQIECLNKELHEFRKEMKPDNVGRNR
jgi:predicted RNase H-like nuclease (RuvC/YqgF family)